MSIVTQKNIHINQPYQNKERFVYFDGLRGFAALVVVFGHFWPFQEIKSLPILNLLVDTKLAVAIFFVLSGVVLSHSVRNMQKSIRWFVFVVLSRYIRLMIPVFSITLLVLILYDNNLIFVDQLPIQYSDWQGYEIFYQFKLSLLDAFKFGIFDAFFNYDASQTYIPPAWTMRPELFASFLLYSFIFLLALVKIDSIPNLFLVLTAVLIYYTKNYIPAFYYFGYFLMGYVIYKISTAESNKIVLGLWAFTLIILIKTTLFYVGLKFLIIDFIFAALIVYLVSVTPSLKKYLSNRFFVWLGDISFPLYLVHVPIFCSFSIFNFIWMSELSIPIHVSWLANFILTISLVLIISHYLTFIDKAALKVNRLLKLKARLSYK